MNTVKRKEKENIIDFLTEPYVDKGPGNNMFDFVMYPMNMFYKIFIISLIFFVLYAFYAQFVGV